MEVDLKHLHALFIQCGFAHAPHSYQYLIFVLPVSFAAWVPTLSQVPLLLLVVWGNFNALYLLKN